MWPKFLQSSYQTYKDDTDLVAKWLAVKAKQCGYPADLLSSPDSSTAAPQAVRPSQRLKGAKRKKAKKAAQGKSASSEDPTSPADAPKYTIKVKDFTALAECIAQSTKPAIKVPMALAKALNRAIKLRQQHNERSRGQTGSGLSTDVEDSNESHSHFLGILENVREILQGLMPSEMHGNLLSQPTSTPSWQEGSGTCGKTQISNIFEHLHIHEPSQEFLDAPDVERAISADAAGEPMYEAEKLCDIEEQYTASHCFFQDVKNIRFFLRQLWTSYKDGGLNLVSVSITTNTAIEFVRSMEQDLLHRFPEKSDYESIVHIFYGAQCLNRGHNPSDKQNPDDLFNFEVYDLAEAVMIPTYIVIQGLQNVIKPNQIPLYKRGYLGVRDTRTSWDQKTAREKFHDDRLVLMEAFPDLMLISMATSKSTLAEDELIRGIRHMTPGKAIPLWLVFSAQCFLDTQHVLGQDVARGFAELENVASAIRSSIKENLDFHASLRIDNWPRQNDYQFRATLAQIEQYVLNDLVADKMKALSISEMLHPPEPFRLLKQFPLLCGLFSFAIQNAAQKVGIDFANAWGSIMYASHLYNATRQEKLLPKMWRDMEMLIALQSPEQLFIGGAPKDPEGYLKRFCLSMGYSATAFARNRRKGAPIASARGPRGLSPLCPVGALFNGRYCRNDDNVTWTQDTLKPIMEAKVDYDSDEDLKENNTRVKTSASGSLIRKPKRSGESIPTTDFLEDLANGLHAETLELSIDYLRVHRFCWMLLRQVNDACKPQLLKMVGAGYLEKENQLPFVVGYIFMAATNTNEIANLLRPRRPGFEISSRLLMTAATALECMIDNGAGEIESKIIAYRMGTAEIDFREYEIAEADDGAQSQSRAL
ncbi:hypothetical protein BDR22DRAFT_431292 [Usnea florida]